MTDQFTWTEFGSREGERSPSEYFESIHTPTLSYTFIEKSLASLDAGLDEFDAEQRDEAKIYANVIVFREAMQYIEEFGIYLYSRLDPDESFVDAITGTRPREVKEIFEEIKVGEWDDIVDEYREGEEGDEWLSRQLGYDKLMDQDGTVSLDELVDEDVELSVDSVEEACNVSLETVKQNLERISDFFLRFDEAYNAIKHGNRVTPISDFRPTVDGPDGEVEIDFDEQFVSFLCKTSGDRRGGHLFTFTAPVRILREQSVDFAQQTKNIYVQMYDIKQRVEESRRSGNEVTLHPNFYGIKETDQGGREFSLKSIENPDATVWLPEESIPDDLGQFDFPVHREVAIAVKRIGSDLVIETEFDNNPSYDYPLLTDFELRSDVENLHGLQVSQNFTVKLYQLPLWQYLELDSLSEIEPIEDVIIRHGDTGESATQHTDDEIDIPDLPDPEFPELLEYMRNVGRAADCEVMAPYYWPPRVLQVIEHYKDEFELTRDIARNLLDDIDELTQNEVATIPTISILDPNEVDDNGKYQTIRHEELSLIWGGIILEVDEKWGSGEFSIVPGDDPRYTRKETREMEAVGATFIEETPNQVFEEFLDKGMDALSSFTPTTELDDAKALFETKRVYGPKFTWYYLDKFHFVFYKEAPSHHEEMVEELKSL